MVNERNEMDIQLTAHRNIEAIDPRSSQST